MSKIIEYFIKDFPSESKSWKGSLVKVAVFASFNFLVPYRFSKHKNLNTFGSMAVFFDRASEPEALLVKEGTIMLCVEDLPTKFLVLHDGATYISLKKLFEKYNEQH